MTGEGIACTENNLNSESIQQKSSRLNRTADTNQTVISNPTTQDNLLPNDMDQTLKQESLDHELNGNLRFEAFKNI